MVIGSFGESTAFLKTVAKFCNAACWPGVMVHEGTSSALIRSRADAIAAASAESAGIVTFVGNQTKVSATRSLVVATIHTL